MSTSDSAREPSMEDILASIRKIIAEDPAPAAAVGDASDPEDAGPALPAAPAIASPGSNASTDFSSSEPLVTPAPMSGRLADALGGLKKASARQEPAPSSDTQPARAPSFGGLDDDLSDLLDDVPADDRPAPGVSAAPDTKGAFSAPGRAAAASPFGSSFNPPAGLRPGRNPEAAPAPAASQSGSTAPSPPFAGEATTSLPFGQKADRGPGFSSDSLLKASSSLLAKSPDRAASTSAGTAQADEPASDAGQSAQADDAATPTAETKPPAATTGPVVIAAMPPAAKTGTSKPETASPSTTASSAPAKSTVERSSAPRPIGFALGAGASPTGPSTLEKTLGISNETPAGTASTSSPGTSAPSLTSGGPDASASASAADDEATEPILMPAKRDTVSATEPLASTSALDELAAGLAASVGSVAGSSSGMKAASEGSKTSRSPELSDGKSASVTGPDAVTAASPSSSTPAPGTSSRTLEETVGELLRPMLREWLDANMPRIVENALRSEMSESVAKSLSTGTGVPPSANVSGGFGAKKPN